MAAQGAGSAVEASGGGAVAHIVLGLRRYGVRVGEVFALHAKHGFPGKGGTQVCILPVGLFRAPVAGIPYQVHDGAVGLMDAHGPGLCPYGTPHFPAQFRTEGGGKADLLGEDGGFPVVQAVQGFLAEQKGNVKPGLFNGILLQGVDLLRRHAPCLDAAAASSLKQLVHLLHIQVRDLLQAVASGEIMAVILVRLKNHLLQGHASQEFLNFPVNFTHVVQALRHGLFSSLLAYAG